MKKEYTEKDLEVIKKQIGREPRNLIGVARRCENGYPQVLITYPLLDKGEKLGVFPTTYWLSCPYLVEKISKLEAEGLVKEIQEEVVGNEKKFEELLSTHEDYAEDRIELLTSGDLKRLKNDYPGLWRVISQSGVGGIMEKEGIKCLHTQYADFLVNQKNPVGEIVDELLAKRFDGVYLDNCNCGGGE
jgi:hypothetical protein